MYITWTDNSGGEASGKIDAHILPIIEVLGLDRAANFLVLFGGKYVYIGSKALQDNNPIASIFGKEDTLKLFERLRDISSVNSFKVPIGKRFLARYWRSLGVKPLEIRQRLKLTDVSVRHLLQSDDQFRSRVERQRTRQRNAAIDEAVALGLVVRVRQHGAGKRSAAW